METSYSYRLGLMIAAARRASEVPLQARAILLEALRRENQLHAQVQADLAARGKALFGRSDED